MSGSPYATAGRPSRCERLSVRNELALSALCLMKILRLGRHLSLGEMLISISIMLWSATPSTTLSFLIRSGLFAQDREYCLNCLECGWVRLRVELGHVLL